MTSPNKEINNTVEMGEKTEILFEKGESSVSTNQNDQSLAELVTAEEYLLNKSITLLPYEKQIFLDLIHSDGLLVSAKGISYDAVLVNLLRVYSDNANLILVINSSDWEEEYYKSLLDKKYVKEVASNVKEREIIYLEGGIQFISTRIFVVDLLKNRIPVELITGIVVLRAHKIIESCQEAFALRLFRQKNKTGFIKAFSSSPESFTIGFMHVERTMRNLFLKELYIWPRFHAVIQESLKPWESQAVEYHVPMSTKMTQIQTYILDIMNFLVKDIKRINRNVDMEEITVENCVTKKFHKILQAQLDYIWHQLSSQTKLIVADLKVLRNLMISVIYNDCVNSYGLIKRYRKTGYAMNNSGWTLLDAAESLFKISKERVYNTKDEFDPEPCPKWKALTEILLVEIPNDLKRTNESKGKHTSEAPKVLILCTDSRTCYQLNQYLSLGAHQYLLFSAMKNEISINKLSQRYQNMSTPAPACEKGLESASESKVTLNLPSQSNKENKDNESKMETDELSEVLTKSDDTFDCNVFRDSYVLTMTQSNLIQNFDENVTASEFALNNSMFEPFPELENLEVTSAIEKAEQPVIYIQTFKTEKDGSKGVDRILNELHPKYVIMYHSNVTAIRQLEVYEAKLRRPSIDRLRVFFLLHARTVEEQSYLTSLRREKQAFEFLIDSKSKMVIPEYQDGKTDEAFTLMKSDEDHTKMENTRKAGGQNEVGTQTSKIIVDMREFRSDLPCLIHRRGIEVIPVTISIGDYILTPEICVERKSISDLIGSLNSGRLYNQCIQMQRFYAKPILLIEFDQNKPFHLQGKYMLSGDAGLTSNTDIIHKIQLLTLHFPKLRLIWSPSPYATAQLFEELKHDKEQPDSNTAAAIGTDNCEQFDIDKFNSDIYDFMTRLPGVNSKNINKIMRNGGSLKNLLVKSREELSELCDSETNGKLLWDSLHVAHLPEKIQSSSSTSGFSKPYTSKFRGRGRGTKKI